MSPYGALLHGDRSVGLRAFFRGSACLQHSEPVAIEFRPVGLMGLQSIARVFTLQWARLRTRRYRILPPGANRGMEEDVLPFQD